MLVLTRRLGEQIVIADEIVVTIVGIEGNKIRLGVEAPLHLRVDRKEVHNRRQAEKASGSMRSERLKARFAVVNGASSA